MMNITVDKQRILRKTTPERDTLQEAPEKSLKWTKAEKALFPYSHSRALSQKDAQRAIDYIQVLVKGQPFQLRYAMAVPLWKRFSQIYCDTGDVNQALRGI